MINLKVRLKNPIFLIQLFLSFFMPILSYVGISAEQLTSWKIVGDLIVMAISNPYIVCLIIISVWNSINDPTTAGISDSYNAINYTMPKRRIK
ncbi:MAG: phage holin [Oscillospiraceae bacterium]